MIETIDLSSLTRAQGKQIPKKLEVDTDGTTRFGRYKLSHKHMGKGVVSKKVFDLLGFEESHFFISLNGIFSRAGDSYDVSWRGADGFRVKHSFVSTGSIYFEIERIIKAYDGQVISSPVIDPEPQTEPEPMAEPEPVKMEPPKGKYYTVPSDWSGEHYLYEKVFKLLENRLNVYLYGDAGTGKNVMAEHIASALDVPFYMTGKITDVYTGVSGFIDANGVYHETALYKALKTGGVFFFDEVDSSDPEALIKINALLANGYIDFPTGRVEINPEKPVFFILAGNTCGNGSTGSYIRQKLDGASLNRMVKLHMDYDKNIEYSAAGNKPEIADLIRKIRDFARENDIEIVAGTRDISQIKILRECGFNPKEALNSTCLATLSEDDREMIYNHVYYHDFME